MLELDGKDVMFSDEDKGRRNTVSLLLQKWGLLNIYGQEEKLQPRIIKEKIDIIKHSDKENWKFVSKYKVGKK